MPFRTDLAAESSRLQSGPLPSGVTREERSFQNLRISLIRLTDPESAREVGKAPGDYATVTTPPFSGGEDVGEEEIGEIANVIAGFLPPEGLVLVVGLGNNDITPDAVGPRTARQILATRHLNSGTLQAVGLEGLRPAAALAPGVLGQTGIETSEIIRSVVREIRPAAVVVIDALAARSASRLGNTIQISTAGISPGSGVQNSRKELSRESLGVPVVSVGIPTVVDAATLAGDLLRDEKLADELRALFEPSGQRMMITPREIDQLIGRGCKTLSLAINKALQPQLSLEEIGFLVS